MNFDDYKKYCLSKKGTYADFPFDDKTLVFRVSNRMFALTNISDKTFSISLKCDPYIAVSLREQYKSIIPGYHLNKKHWNTVTIDGTIPDNVIYGMIDMSYGLVFKKLTKLEKEKVLKSLIK